MELVYFLLFAYAGMLVHFLKKQLKDGDEKLTVFFKYFSSHAISSVITLVAVTITVVAMYYEAPSQVTFLSCIGLGYAGDSVINKWKAKDDAGIL